MKNTHIVDGLHARINPGQPILLLHGLGESSLCFEKLMRYKPNLGWIAPDLHGYGRSPWPQFPLSLEEIGQNLLYWLKKEGIKPLLIGHSMSGVLGTYMCEVSPEQFTGFLNVDGNISPNDCTFSSIAAGQPKDEFINTGFDIMKNEIVAKGVALNDPALKGYYASLMFACPKTFYLHSQQLVHESSKRDLARRLASLKIPVTYVAGSPGGASSESLSLLKTEGVKVISIEPSGHWPFIDQTQSFITLI